MQVLYAIPHEYACSMAKQMLKEEGIDIPMVTTLHGTDITLVGNHPFYKPAVTFSINKSDIVTSVSENLRQETLKLFSITNDIEVIPNFIELNKNIDDSTIPCYRSVIANENERVVTHISNFRKVKRIPDVIKIFNRVQQQIPAKLMMVGDGPEKEKAEQLCQELGIQDKVIFFGNSNEIDRILSYSDLFLLPSETESFGLAALEAMALSVPVISSNSGGLREVNFDGVSGYLSNVGDIEGMAANAIKILQDNETLNNFKSNALTTAKKFDIQNILPLYEELYLRAISIYA
jgi:N-acetyl-alpha-D-glucosaminyl L-malate synthase BshA